MSNLPEQQRPSAKNEELERITVIPRVVLEGGRLVIQFPPEAQQYLAGLSLRAQSEVDINNPRIIENLSSEMETREAQVEDLMTRGLEDRLYSLAAREEIYRVAGLPITPATYREWSRMLSVHSELHLVDVLVAFERSNADGCGVDEMDICAAVQRAISRDIEHDSPTETARHVLGILLSRIEPLVESVRTDEIRVRTSLSALDTLIRESRSCCGAGEPTVELLYRLVRTFVQFRSGLRSQAPSCVQAADRLPSQDRSERAHRLQHTTRKEVMNVTQREERWRREAERQQVLARELREALQTGKVLIVEDDLLAKHRMRLGELGFEEGRHFITVTNLEDARAVLARGSIVLLVTDMDFPRSQGDFELMQCLPLNANEREELIARNAGMELAAEAAKHGISVVASTSREDCEILNISKGNYSVKDLETMLCVLQTGQLSSSQR